MKIPGSPSILVVGTYIRQRAPVRICSAVSLHLPTGLEVMVLSLSEIDAPKIRANSRPSAVRGTMLPLCPSGMASLMECLMISAVDTQGAVSSRPRESPRGRFMSGCRDEVQRMMKAGSLADISKSKSSL